MANIIRNKPMKIKSGFFNPLMRHCCFTKEELKNAPKTYYWKNSQRKRQMKL